MKKHAIVLISVLFMFAFATNAQEQKSQEKPKKPTVEERVNKMARDLSLNDVEKASVKTLLEKQDAENKKFNKENPDKESADYKTKKKELQTKQNAELKAVLGDEKYKKYQEIRKAEKEAAKQAEKKP